MYFIYERLLRLRSSMRGQTMAEYAFILAAVAVVVWVTYQILGQDLNTMINKVEPLLNTAS